MIPDWCELFCPEGTEPDFTLPLRIVRKHGEPLLLLPRESIPAARALDLYAAQTLRARCARALLRRAVRAGLPVPFERDRAPVRGTAPFARLLRRLAGDRWPVFAVLLGNPRATGRRWVILVFAPDGAPQLVIKVGVGAEACALIGTELSTLDEIPLSTPGRPVLRDRWIGDGAAAFALDFAEGSAPRVGDGDAELARLLESWIDLDRHVTLADVPAWQCVRAATADAAVVERACAGRKFRPAVFHGDFAPWNVKISGAGWTVFDWERGSATGVPGWDWFHFIVQPAILVQKLSPERVFERVSALLQTEVFQHYATGAEIAEITDALFQGYLLYLTEVVRPADGRTALRALRDRAFRPRASA